MTSFWLTLLFRLTDVAPGLVRLCRPLFVRLAWSFCPGVRRATAANGARLAPTVDPRTFGLAVLGHFYDFVADVGRGRATAGAAAPPDDVAAYRAVRAARRGAVLVTAHMGSFEVGLTALAAEERTVHVVFKRDAVPAFDALRRRLRGRLGVIEAPVDDGSFAAWARLREALLRDEVVVIQGDRCLPGQKGQDVPVLGGHLTLPTGPFKLALSADAPVVPLFAVRQPDGRVSIQMRPAISVTDVASSLAQYAAELTAQLEAHPTQWLVLHPAFREDAGGANAK
jgi:lauroyl/myristoyl acyltransferase